MGLHNKSRDYLLKEFIKRNYKGIAAKDFKSLLALNSEDFVNYQKQKEKITHISQKLENLCNSLELHRDLKKNFELISNTLLNFFKFNYIIIARYNPAAREAAAVYKKKLKIKPGVIKITAKNKKIINEAFKNKNYNSNILDSFARLAPKLNKPVFFPIEKNKKTTGFIIAGCKNSNDLQNQTDFSFLNIILGIIAEHFNILENQKKILEQKKDKEKQNRLLSRLVTTFITGLSPDQQTLLSFLKEQSIKGCMLVKKTKKKAAFLVYVGYKDLPRSPDFTIKSTLPAAGFIKDKELEYYKDVLAGKRLAVKTIYSFKMKDIKDDIYLFIPDLPASLSSSKQLREAFCRYISILLFNFQGGESVIKQKSK
ncbi:MAG TPA: hypothetical protein VKS21_07715 [Spirochaetota bacterium]|nr:hypothetical protein [Spirochaetota bacterium]